MENAIATIAGIGAIKAFFALEDSIFWILSEACLLLSILKTAYCLDMLMENGISLSVSKGASANNLTVFFLIAMPSEDARWCILLSSYSRKSPKHTHKLDIYT